MFGDFVAGAFGTADFFSRRQHYDLKMMVATGAVVFEYGHRASLKSLGYFQIITRLSVLGFGFVTFGGDAQRIVARDRHQRGYFQAVAA